MRSQFLVVIQGIDGRKYDFAVRTATDARHVRVEDEVIVRKYLCSLSRLQSSNASHTKKKFKWVY